jgi:hypothetical protein
MAQVVEHLVSKHKALISNPSNSKKRKKREEEEEGATYEKYSGNAKVILDQTVLSISRYFPICKDMYHWIRVRLRGKTKVGIENKGGYAIIKQKKQNTVIKIYKMNNLTDSY